jgi:hypothetical protein
LHILLQLKLQIFLSFKISKFLFKIHTRRF